MQEAQSPGFLAALGRVPSGLFIVTAADADKRCAYLASFVQQVSFEPMLFAIACHPQRYPFQLISKTKKFGLSIIPESDKILMKMFAKGHGPDEDPLASVAAHVIDGVPLLKDSIGGAVFDVVQETTPGDHAIFFGKPKDGVLFDADLRPWVHIRKSAKNY